MAEKKQSEVTDISLPHPRETQSLIGHQGNRDIFIKALRRENLPHAWILSGEKGIGKCTFAFQMCHEIFGEHSKRLIYSATHPDIHYISCFNDKAEISVDQIRALKGVLGHTSMTGGWRVIIIDAAEDMNRNAANALLKILEEPQKNTLYFLITHRAYLLMPTLKSRAVMLRFKSLSPSEYDAVITHNTFFQNQEDLNNLKNRANNSPGKLAVLLANGGRGLWDQYTYLLKTRNMTEILSFSQFLAKKENVSSFSCLRQIAIESFRHSSDLSYEDLEFKVRAWDKTQRLFSDIDTLNTDKKMAILSLIGSP